MLTGVKETPCICFGLCTYGPNVIIYPDGVVYSGVGPQDVAQIVREHLAGGRVVQRLLFKKKEEPVAPADDGSDAALDDGQGPASTDRPGGRSSS